MPNRLELWWPALELLIANVSVGRVGRTVQRKHLALIACCYPGEPGRNGYGRTR